MFKIVVLCAFFAAAAAEPGALIAAPIAQYSTYVAPATTSISQHSSSVIHPSPLGYYSAATYAIPHFIKKRSPQFFPLNYYTPSTYIAPTPYVASAPLLNSASILPAAPIAPISPALHLIKKRSAPLLPAAYIAPQTYATATAPILTTAYTSTAPLFSTPLISQPITYTHFIKKRSAPLLNTFIAPTSYSHQSRFDLQTTHTPLTSIAYSAPIAYNAAPIAYSHVY